MPLKNAVSTSTPRTMPGAPSRITHQSWLSSSTSRRRRVSQPSIHLPRSVYSPSRHTAAAPMTRRSFGAKNSSLAATTAPPRRSEARSTRSVNEPVIAGVRRRRASGGFCPRRVRRPRTSFPPCRLSVRPAYGVSLCRCCSRVASTTRLRVRIPHDEIGVVARTRFGPLRAPSPASAAGAALIQRARSAAARSPIGHGVRTRSPPATARATRCRPMPR